MMMMMMVMMMMMMMWNRAARAACRSSDGPGPEMDRRVARQKGPNSALGCRRKERRKRLVGCVSLGREGCVSLGREGCVSLGREARTRA